MSKFPQPWYLAYSDMGPIALCVDEWVLIQISFLLRNKPNWKQLYHQCDQVELWRLEVKSQFATRIFDIDTIFNYVIQELQWYEELEAWDGISSNGFTVLFDDKVIMSGDVIPLALNQRLKLASNHYQLLTELGTNKTKSGTHSHRHLVDPYLYPLQYGKTPIRVLEKLNQVTFSTYDSRMATFKPEVSPSFQYKSYQQLPTLLKYVDGLYTTSSYINNLHPKFTDMYQVIEEVFNYSVPGLELVLSRYQSDQLVRIQVPGGADVYKDLLRENNSFSQGEINNVKKPLTLQYTRPATSKIKLTSNFKSLKVIPRFTNIELSPENPRFSGSQWQVEGTINEDIVASIVYCYDCDNISNAKLSLRCTFDEPYYEQDDRFYCQYFFDLNNNVPMNKPIGSIEIIDNGICVFPNIFQNRMDSFELDNKSKLGHIKLLILYVVDPYNDLVPTTELVPPQQKQWWEDEEELESLSKDIKANIKELVGHKWDWPQLIEEAHEVQLLMLREQKWAVQDEIDRYKQQIQSNSNDINDDLVPPFERCFSLCQR